MKTSQLQARERTEKGSRACRSLRSQGLVPANLYGAEKMDDAKTTLENINLAVSAYELVQLIDRHETVLEVSWGSRKELAQLIEVQRDSFGDDVLHIDLRKIDINKPIQSMVTIIYKGEPKGVKAGGVLTTSLHHIELTALPTAMPREITIRVDDLELNESMYVKDVELPEGTTSVTDGDHLVAAVMPPVEEVEEETGEPLPTEPEVIGGKKEEEGGDA